METKMRLAGFLFGTAFGALLAWAGITDHDTIRDMLLLRDPHIFLVMGTAMATAFAGTRLLRAFRARAIVGGAPISWPTTRPSANHVLGSVIFGLGWSIAGTCPGPAAAQIGHGQLAGLFTVAGLLGGVALRAWWTERRARVREQPLAVAPIGL